ncbi:MAG: glycerophosphodiester phosphodiesterase family protein [Armatimonadota bacterium]|nr:glycerophosphodiester phosphodiesterase family protein [Armatimonadota bacterium]
MGLTPYETPFQIHAHRGGGRLESDENTLAAFQYAYSLGIRGFETDLRMCRTGELICLHNETVDERTNGHGRVTDMTATELRQLRTREGNPLLFFDELVEFLAGKKGLYLELEMKGCPADRLDEYVARIAAGADALQEGNAVVVASFQPALIKRYQQERPQAETMLITGLPCNAESIAAALSTGVPRLACTWDGSSRSAVRAAHQVGLILCGWPGNTIQDYLLGVALGFDHLCTDIPGQTLWFIQQHMTWL